MSENDIGDIHIYIREDGSLEMTTSFPIAELNLVLDKIKKMILDDDYTKGEIPEPESE